MLSLRLLNLPHALDCLVEFELRGGLTSALSSLRTRPRKPHLTCSLRQLLVIGGTDLVVLRLHVEFSADLVADAVAKDSFRCHLLLAHDLIVTLFLGFEKGASLSLVLHSSFVEEADRQPQNDREHLEEVWEGKQSVTVWHRSDWAAQFLHRLLNFIDLCLWESLKLLLTLPDVFPLLGVGLSHSLDIVVVIKTVLLNSGHQLKHPDLVLQVDRIHDSSLCHLQKELAILFSPGVGTCDPHFHFALLSELFEHDCFDLIPRVDDVRFLLDLKTHLFFILTQLQDDLGKFERLCQALCVGFLVDVDEDGSLLRYLVHDFAVLGTRIANAVGILLLILLLQVSQSDLEKLFLARQVCLVSDPVDDCSEPHEGSRLDRTTH